VIFKYKKCFLSGFDHKRSPESQTIIISILKEASEVQERIFSILGITPAPDPRPLVRGDLPHFVRLELRDPTEFGSIKIPIHL
jgi:hypothetical protein